MRRYEVIFFDLDHTLIDTRGQYALGLQAALDTLYGEDDVPESWYERFFFHHEQLWQQYDKRTITAGELRRQRFLRAWKDCGIEKTIREADEFHEVYDKTFETTLFTYPGTLDLLEVLSTHHRLGIITNGTPDLQDRKMGIVGIERFFPKQSVIISENVGLAKPHPSVYNAACEAMSIGPKDALMIGDSFRNDVEGARKCGMDALWYVPDEVLRQQVAALEQGEKLYSTWQEVVEAVEKMEQTR